MNKVSYPRKTVSDLELPESEQRPVGYQEDAKIIAKRIAESTNPVGLLFDVVVATSDSLPEDVAGDLNNLVRVAISDSIHLGLNFIE